MHRPDFQRDVQDARTEPGQEGIQPGLSDGGFRRARQQAAGAPARRFARPHGQAQRRHHREADSLELPRRPVRAGILHLDARRAQGSGRHRAQDRRLRLHDPQAGGRGAGRDHPGSRIAARPTASGFPPCSKAKTKWSSSATGSWAASRATTSSIRRTRRNFSSASNEEIDEDKAKRIEAAGIERVRIRSVLTCESKHGVCVHCYGRNLATGAPGQARRSRRHHRRAIHRRAGHAAHDADVPHRRHGGAGVQDAADQGQARRHDPLQRTARRRTGRRQQHRAQQERLRFQFSATTAANWKTTSSSSARSFPSRTAARSRRARPSCSGTPTTCRFFPRRPAR